MLPTLLAIALGLAAAADLDADADAHPDPAARDLVARLGSPRFAERESASDAIRALGSEALPALPGAREAPDPEIQNRALVLLDELERKLILMPTLVRPG